MATLPLRSSLLISRASFCSRSDRRVMFDLDVAEDRDTYVRADDGANRAACTTAARINQRAGVIPPGVEFVLIDGNHVLRAYGRAQAAPLTPILVNNNHAMC